MVVVVSRVIGDSFDAFGGEYGSSQTITVPANSSNEYLMKNDEWSVKVAIDKIDSALKACGAQQIGETLKINVLEHEIPEDPAEIWVGSWKDLL